HEGSTKSYQFVRDHYEEVVHADFIPPRTAITASYGAGEVLPVTLHDGSEIHLRKLDPDYDPTNRGVAFNQIRARQRQNEYLTGLIYIDGKSTDFHAMQESVATPMNRLPVRELNPGSAG